VSCGAKQSKKEMLRFVLGQDKQLVRDDSGHRAGRGAYVCRGSSCIETLMNRRRFEKVFRVPREQRQEVAGFQKEGR
jgi:predicted RNA-binding protein YlxR (DUF448 family)